MLFKCRPSRLVVITHLILFSFFFAISSQAQICYPNGITFASQSDVDLFPTLNPGCTIIGENLTINGADITNLDSLYSIEIIQGNFSVFSSGLTNFQGLNNLDSIAGEIRIQGGQTLVDFEGLESLKSIGNGSSYHTISNSSITDFTGLDSLVELAGSLDILYCGNLTSLSGLEGLTSLSELTIDGCSLTSLEGLDNVSTIGNLSLRFLSNLTNLNGLENLDTCYYLDISDMSSLNDFSAFSSFTTAAWISISGCDILTSLDGLDSLLIVSSSIFIRYNDLLDDISALENADFSNLNNLYIYNNPALSICHYTSICGYLDIGGNTNIYSNAAGCNGTIEISNACCMDDPIWCPESMETCYPNGITFASQSDVDLFPTLNPGCTIIGENLTINGADITNLDSLYSIEIIQGNFSVFSSSLTNFQGLNNLDSIAGEIRIQGGQTLVDFEGLESLKSIGSGSSYHTISNSSITDFTGLDSLVELAGSLDILYCGNLTSLSGLEGLTSLSELTIDGCSLTSLEGLDNVSTIGNLSLRFLSNLTNLNGLENLDTCYYLDISDMSSLNDFSAFSSFTTAAWISISECDILTSLDGLDSLLTVSSSIFIRYNDLLDDISALENADFSNLNNLYIYNNPALSTCHYTSICGYLDIGGNTNIYSNAAGCNGTIEISNACCMDDPIWCPESMETCYPNGITFASQSDVDLFPTLNPGCTIIGENLTINGADITNLDSLYSIEIIQGNFSVFSSGLTNFQGLNNLDSIAGEIRIQGGQTLVDFEGLESLKSIGNGSSYHTVSNSSITDFTGLDSLVELAGSLDILYCGNLTSLSGLEGLTSLSELTIDGCSLTSMEGLDNVSAIGNLSLRFLSNLTNLNGLENLDTCYYLDISDMSSLNDFSAFSSFTTAAWISISDCDILTSLDGLDSLLTVSSSIFIRYNELLTDISALKNAYLKDLNNLYIYNNPELSICSINSICDYLENESNANIYGNAVGCNGVLEIEYDCLGLLSIFETPATSSFTSNSSDNFWHTASNWRSNTVPTDSSFAIIPVLANTIIEQDSIANCKLLKVHPDATLTIETGSQLNIWSEEE